MVKDTPGQAAGMAAAPVDGDARGRWASPAGPALPSAVPQVWCSPRQPRRCLRSGHGSPPCRGGTVTWRLRALLPTPHRELHPLHGPQGPTAQPTAAGGPGQKRGKKESFKGVKDGRRGAGKMQHMGAGRKGRGDPGSPSPPTPGHGSGIVHRFRGPLYPCRWPPLCIALSWDPANLPRD